MTALQQLNEIASAALRKKHPQVPDHALPKMKYSDKDANSLTRAVIDFIKLEGNFAERVNTSGRVIREGRTYRWIYGTGTRDSADIHAMKAGRSVMIEIKIGKDRQSRHQKEYQAKVEATGAVYLIVRTFDDFIKQWEVI